MEQEVVPPHDGENRAVVKADAKERSKRTFKQGLIFAVVAAVATVALNVIGNWTHDEFITASSWYILGTSVFQAAAMAGLAYIQRFTSTPEHSSEV